MEQEAQLVDLLLDMPMAAEPGFIVCRCLDHVEPSLRAVVYGILIDHGQKRFQRLIPKGTGMGEDDVDMAVGDLFLHIGFDLC